MFKDIIKRPLPGSPHLPAIPICCFSLKTARCFRRGVCGVWGALGPSSAPSIAAPAEEEGGRRRSWEPAQAHRDRRESRRALEAGREEVATLPGSHRQHTAPSQTGRDRAGSHRQEESTRMPPHTLVTAMALQGTCEARAKWLFNVWSFLGCSSRTADREKLARMGPSTPS